MKLKKGMSRLAYCGNLCTTANHKMKISFQFVNMAVHRYEESKVK